MRRTSGDDFRRRPERTSSSVTRSGGGAGAGGAAEGAGAAADGAATGAAAAAAPVKSRCPRPRRQSRRPRSRPGRFRLRRPIASSTPAAGAGISASTLSVEISNSGSSRSTGSPTRLIQRTMVPSAIDSPIWGIDNGSGHSSRARTPKVDGRAVRRMRRLADRLGHRRMRVNGPDDSSTVHSSRSASTASATSSVERGPMMCTPSTSSYLVPPRS